MTANAERFIALSMVPPLAKEVANAINNIDPSATVTPADFGAIGNGFADDTNAFILMKAARPKSVYWGDSSKNYMTRVPIVVDYKTFWRADGAKITYNWRPLGITQTMVRFDAGSDGSSVYGLTFDHDSIDGVMPWLYSGLDQVCLDAIRVASNNTTWDTCTVLRSGLNGISFMKSSYVSGDGLSAETAIRNDFTGYSFFPINTRVHNCFFQDCGYAATLNKFVLAIPDILYRGGGGALNFLSSSRATATNCIMDSCSVGFTVDFAGGAVGCVASNIISVNSGRTVPGASSPANGWGMWLGSQQNVFSGLQSIGSLKHGIVIDSQATNNTFTNCMAYNNNQHGFHGIASGLMMTGCQAINNSQELTNTYDGFHFNVAALNITGVNVVACNAQSQGNKQRYGFNLDRTTGDVAGRAGFCNFEGVTAPYNLHGSTGFTIV